MDGNTINVAALRAKLEELKTGKKTENNEFLAKFYNPPYFDANCPQRSVIRILPGIVKENGETSPFFTETSLHKIGGKNVHCIKKSGKICPICEFIKPMWNSNPDAARQLKARKRFYMNVIARERIVKNFETGKEEIKQNDGPLIYSCGIKIFQKILGQMLEVVEETAVDITDLKKGFDFKIKKEMQTSGYPSYDESKVSRTPSVAGTDEEIENWIKNLHDLNSLIKYATYEELLKEVEILKSSKEYDIAADKKLSDKQVSTYDPDGDKEDDDKELEAALEKIRKGN